MDGSSDWVQKKNDKGGQWKTPSGKPYMGEGATLDKYAGTKSGLFQRPLYFRIFVIWVLAWVSRQMVSGQKG